MRIVVGVTDNLQRAFLRDRGDLTEAKLLAALTAWLQGPFRRRALLRRWSTWRETNRGRVVEGYPHDMSKQPEGKKMSSSFLYNGTRRMYQEAGFTYERPKGQKNCVMTLTISPA